MGKGCVSCKYLDFYYNPISKRVEGVRCRKGFNNNAKNNKRCSYYLYLHDKEVNND